MSYKISGWDQICRLEYRNIRKHADKLLLLVHWNLIMNNTFKCCGLGNEKYITKLDNEISSELLPNGWNTNNLYNLRYIYNDALFILVGSNLINDLFFIYLLQPDSEVLSSITFKISDVIISNPKKLKIPDLFNNYEIVLKTIQNELVDTVLKESGKLKQVIPEIVNRSRAEIWHKQSAPIAPSTSCLFLHRDKKSFSYLDDFWERHLRQY